MSVGLFPITRLSIRNSAIATIAEMVDLHVQNHTDLVWPTDWIIGVEQVWLVKFFHLLLKMWELMRLDGSSSSPDGFLFGILGRRLHF